MSIIKNDYKKLFFSKGSCSQSTSFILNREFFDNRETEELASSLLAAGPNQDGHQCGILWGSALSAGAKSSRTFKDINDATFAAITVTQELIKSFEIRTKCVNCREITKCNWKKPWGALKYFATGKVFTCLDNIDKWIPEAINIINENQSKPYCKSTNCTLSCASEVIKKMGATEEEMVIVAGFAGGIGLSGQACGALGAVIWFKSLDWCNRNPGKTPPFFNNTYVKKTLQIFKDSTDSEMLCSKISGTVFNTSTEHTAYIQNSGCKDLINALAQI
jgi:hypothetical protein